MLSQMLCRASRRCVKPMLFTYSTTRLVQANICRPSFSSSWTIPKSIVNNNGKALMRQCSPVNVNNHHLILSKNFHLSQRNRAGPLVWMILRPVMKVVAVLSGRAFRKWWKELPKDKKTYFRGAIHRARFKILGAVTGAVVLFTLNYVLHLEDTPLTGRRRYMAFTKSQYQKIAEFEAGMHLGQYEEKRLPADHPATEVVINVMRQLYKGNLDVDEMRPLTFQVAVIDDDSTVNAFVLTDSISSVVPEVRPLIPLIKPNLLCVVKRPSQENFEKVHSSWMNHQTGHVFVFTGLLKMMDNADQLAMVLGHEMAHAILSHGVELVNRTHLLDFALIGLMAAIWAFLPNDGIALVAHWFYNKISQIILEMPYSRNLEREADEVGLLLASKACFDVREAPVFWTYMDVQEKLTDAVSVEWLSTHPSHESRAERLNEMMAKAIDIRRQCQCPRLPAKDPRLAIAQLHEMVQMQEKIKNESANTAPILVTVPSTRGALLRDAVRSARTINPKRTILQKKDEPISEETLPRKCDVGKDDQEIMAKVIPLV